jgi:hypothetical protein
MRRAWQREEDAVRVPAEGVRIPVISADKLVKANPDVPDAVAKKRLAKPSFRQFPKLYE